MSEVTANFLWKNCIVTKGFFLLRSCHGNGAKHQLSKLEITNFSEKAKSVEASKANQSVISLPLIHEY